MKKLLAHLCYIGFILGIVTGCDRLANSFVVDASEPLSVSDDSPMAFKVTSGVLYSATNSGGAIRGTVSTTNQVLPLGSDMAMTVSISRSRHRPQ